jgi:predicted Zn-ribbon and HTH transcriptional regulator
MTSAEKYAHPGFTRDDDRHDELTDSIKEDVKCGRCEWAGTNHDLVANGRCPECGSSEISKW